MFDALTDCAVPLERKVAIPLIEYICTAGSRCSHLLENDSMLEEWIVLKPKGLELWRQIEHTAKDSSAPINQVSNINNLWSTCKLSPRQSEHRVGLHALACTQKSEQNFPHKSTRQMRRSFNKLNKIISSPSSDGKQSKQKKKQSIQPSNPPKRSRLQFQANTTLRKASHQRNGAQSRIPSLFLTDLARGP